MAGKRNGGAGASTLLRHKLVLTFAGIMNTRSISLQVSGPIGAVSAEYMLAENNKCIMTLAHGAGAGTDHTFMVTLASYLAAAGIGRRQSFNLSNGFFYQHLPA